MSNNLENGPVLTDEQRFSPPEPNDESHNETGAPASADADPADDLPHPQAVDEAGDKSETWHVEAGRKGAQRIHQLIQEGKLYEREHGLKRGRQRLRQLIQEGWLYEREHGLAPKRKKPTRLSRRSRHQVLTLFCNCLFRMVKPAYRDQVTRMIKALEAKED